MNHTNMKQSSEIWGLLMSMAEARESLDVSPSISSSQLIGCTAFSLFFLFKNLPLSPLMPTALPLLLSNLTSCLQISLLLNDRLLLILLLQLLLLALKLLQSTLLLPRQLAGLPTLPDGMPRLAPARYLLLPAGDAEAAHLLEQEEGTETLPTSLILQLCLPIFLLELVLA